MKLNNEDSRLTPALPLLNLMNHSRRMKPNEAYQLPRLFTAPFGLNQLNRERLSLSSTTFIQFTVQNSYGKLC